MGLFSGKLLLGWQSVAFPRFVYKLPIHRHIFVQPLALLKNPCVFQPGVMKYIYMQGESLEAEGKAKQKNLKG